jgi:hypothetical protein
METSFTENELKRPKILPSETIKTVTRLGNLYITKGYMGQHLHEVFISVRRNSELKTLCEAIGRLITLLLKKRVPAKEVVEELINIDGGSYDGSGNRWKDNREIKSIPDAIALVIDNSVVGAPHLSSEEIFELFTVIKTQLEMLSKEVTSIGILESIQEKLLVLKKEFLA